MKLYVLNIWFTSFYNFGVVGLIGLGVSVSNVSGLLLCSIALTSDLTFGFLFSTGVFWVVTTSAWY